MSPINVRRIVRVSTIQIVVVKSIIVIPVVIVSVAWIVTPITGIIVHIITIVGIAITEIAVVGIAVAISADLDGQSAELSLRDTTSQQNGGAYRKHHSQIPEHEYSPLM